MTELLSQLLPIWTEGLLALGALVLVGFGAFIGAKRPGLISTLAVLVLLLAAGFSAFGPLGIMFNDAFIQDPMAAFAKVAICLASAVVIVLGHGWLKRANDQKFEFPVLVLLAALGMAMMVSAGDLI